MLGAPSALLAASQVLVPRNFMPTLWLTFLCCYGCGEPATEEDLLLEELGYDEAGDSLKEGDGFIPPESPCPFQRYASRGEDALVLLLEVQDAKETEFFSVAPVRKGDEFTLVSSNPVGFGPGQVSVLPDDQLMVYHCRGTRWEWVGRLDLRIRPVSDEPVTELVTYEKGTTRETMPWTATATVLKPARKH